ncbi:MAG: hypothetical protein A3K19_11685 [Lentisphaerae bacterium RIFOXYB12_FULL_65_16]|nr:MAG: hypothetical protein A3K18_07625 [Lentisphaerae bacterium RIFOXYA12_64_32]OGV84735.1 MAG: hypothetical protein A3K19_11685 [Lentisphaerae bacterium RIFOXYB12_FULL_65_16]
MNGRRIVVEGQSQLRCEAFDVPEQLKDAYDALVRKDKDYLGVIVDWTDQGGCPPTARPSQRSLGH